MIVRLPSAAVLPTLLLAAALFTHVAMAQTTPAPATSTPATTTPATTPPAAPRASTAPRPPATLSAGQFRAEAEAKAHCAADPVVWVNNDSKVIHQSSSSSYGKTKIGAYMCNKEATAAGFHPPRPRAAAAKPTTTTPPPAPPAAAPSR